MNASGKISKDGDGKLNVPDSPIVAFICDGGVGLDIWSASQKIIDISVEKV